MSNPNRMKIVYSPAIKEIHFYLFEAENPVKEKYDSLEKYSKGMQGSFVLNLHGNAFLDDIMKPFAGRPSVPVEMKSTRSDYEDFRELVCSYNQNDDGTKTRIDLQELSKDEELLDMRTSFRLIKDQGRSLLRLLSSSCQNIDCTDCKSPHSREYLSRVCEKIRAEAKKIQKNLDSLSDGNIVNLCFIGAYSSGKSSLINALLGYKIMPESKMSETAKMVRISGVRTLEDSTVTCRAKENENGARLVWDKKTNAFIFDECTLPEEMKVQIQNTISEHSGERLHEQIYNILKYLNGQQGLANTVDVGFPIPLDTEEIQYEICDTPGTDSNYGDHKRVLMDALKKQSNSIAIFVLKPDAIEGSANNILLNTILKENENQNTLIDMEHSFFVINRVDPPDADNYELVNAELKGDDFVIKLSERKLFFTSAKVAYAAKAMKNKIATPLVEDFYKSSTNCYESKNGKFYRYNHFGNSTYATEKMRAECDAILSDAEKRKDMDDIYLVCSGLPALEMEIQKYGDKYAASVKTCAVIKSINAAVETVQALAYETETGTDTEINDLKNRLDDELKKINSIIKTTAGDFKSEPPQFKEKLQIDSRSFVFNVINPVEDRLKAKLHSFMNIFKVQVDDEMQQLVLADVSEIGQKYTSNYTEKRKTLLTEIRDSFIESLLSKIDSDDSLTDDVKKHIKNFTIPNIPEMGLTDKIEDMFDAATKNNHTFKKWLLNFASNSMNNLAKAMESVNTNSDADESEDAGRNGGDTEIQEVPSNHPDDKFGNFFGKMKETAFGISKGVGKFAKSSFGKATDGVKTAAKKLDEQNEKVKNYATKDVNPKEFIDSVKQHLHSIQESYTAKLSSDFRNALDTLCNDIMQEFSANVERYSTKIRALKEDNAPLDFLSAEMKSLKKNAELCRTELLNRI